MTDAIAQGATIAGATQKKSPRSRRALLTRLVVLAQLKYDPQKLPPDKTGEAAVGHYFRNTRGVTRISVYDQCYRIAENHETKDMFPSLPPATRNLIIANVAVYLGEVLIGDALTVDFALWPIGTLSLHGKIPGFQAWQIITYSFLHANTTHLFILETVRRTSSASLVHIACRDCRSLVS
jgi:membrane associated rhomboid family serine protease